MEGFSTLSEAELRRILGGVEKLPADLASLTDVVGGHDARLDGHDTKLANHETRIGVLETTIVTPPDLTALQAEVAVHETRLDEHDTDLAAIAATLGSLPDFAAHETRLDGHDTAISTLSARTDALDNRIDGHDTDIGTLSSRIDGHDVDIAALQAKAPRVVFNEAGLLAAMATPGKIWVVGLITLAAGAISTTADLDFDGVGTDAGFLLPHNGASQQTVMYVKALRNKFRNLLFTTNHPLTTGRSFQDIGLRLGSGATEDCSGMDVKGCRFEGLAWGILRDGNSSSANTYGITVEKCTFRGIYMGGVLMTWNAHDVHIINNLFEQRTASQTHDIEFNAVYLALRCDRPVVELNTIKRFGRIAIEIFNDLTIPAAANSNQDPQVNFNTISEPLPFSSHTPIGISILGKGTARYVGNVIYDCVIGIEVPGNPVDTAWHKVHDNSVFRSKNQGMSINGVYGADVKGNLIDRVAIDGFPGITNDPMGMEIIHGGRNVKVHDNTFKDAGRFNVWVAGRGLTITAITNAADGLFTVSGFTGGTSQPNGWYVGKRICLRGIGGMTALNDQYYTITFLSGLTFRVGVDTSAMAAYTSGGQVQEDFMGLSICDNDFYVDDEIDPTWSSSPSFARSIYMHDFQQAVVQGNTRFKSSLLSGFWGTYSIVNYGTVYQDFAGGTVSTTSGEVVIAGSNQTITVFPG